MEKLHYISPSIKVADYDTESDMLAGSPQGTNVQGLGIVSNQNADQTIIGRSRKNVWDDEEEEE